MLTKLIEEILPLIEGIEFKDNPSAEKIEEQLVIENPDNWKITNPSGMRHAFKRYFKDNHSDLYTKIEDHTGNTFYKATERTPPFIVLGVVFGFITPEEYAQKILEAPTDAKIVINYWPEDKFVPTIWNLWREVKKAKEGYVSEPMTTGEFTIPKLGPDNIKVLDAVFGGFGMPKWGDFQKALGSVGSIQSQLESLAASIERERKEMDKKEKDYQKSLATLQTELASKPFKEAVVKGDGTIPNGKIVMKSAKDVFGIKAKFDIPVWEWDGPHPDVPAADPHYIFREDLLVRALYAIISNQRMYLQGHTGTGKTTLIEQIASRLNWPFMRINFDSEITRMDLIGRDTLKDGKSVFIDGVLPRMLSGPYLACFDEIDFCRPDVAYVMQSALEGNGLTITEDGGRRVEPHPMLRIFGTGNTVGQGDEHGMYQGARPQSLALLDRFTIWAKVDYLGDKERLELLKRHVPSLTEEETTIISKYITEHLAAFSQAKILQPISPRGMLAVGRAVAHLNSVFTGKKNIREALSMVVLDRATQSDHQVLHGIIDRVTKD